MGNHKTTTDPLWLNQSDMAKALGISTQAFRRWGIEPAARVGREVLFSFADVLDARIEHELKKVHSETSDGDDLGKKKYLEEYRLTRARRVAQEQKNEIQSAKVVPTEFATFALSNLAAQIASILDTLPLTMRREHPDLETRHIDTFSREIAKARNKAAGLADELPHLVEDYVESLAER